MSATRSTSPAHYCQQMRGLGLPVQDCVYLQSVNSAFELTFGCQHQCLSQSVATIDTTALDLHAVLIEGRLEKSYGVAAARQADAQHSSEIIRSAHHRDAEFKIGGLVWVTNRMRRAKLEHRFLGPSR